MKKTAGSRVSLIPAKAKITAIAGKELAGLAQAAKLSRTHPVIIEMGKRLLTQIGSDGGVFHLGDPALQAKAAELEREFVAGLKRVAVLLGPGNVATRSLRDGDRLVFWYVPNLGGRKTKKVGA